LSNKIVIVGKVYLFKEARHADYTSGRLCGSRSFTFVAQHRTAHRNQHNCRGTTHSSIIPCEDHLAVISGGGPRGGVTLARDAQAITLLEVVEAIDGPIQLNECVTDSGACEFEDNCPLHNVWCDAQEELVTRLKNTTFADMVAKS
jgi:hypothetical protein